MLKVRSFIYITGFTLLFFLFLLFTSCSDSTTEVSPAAKSPLPTLTQTPSGTVINTSIPTPVPTPTPMPTPTPTPTQPPIIKVATASIGATGDILMHEKLYKSGYDATTSTYNYDHIFPWFSKYVSEVDYAVANLEVTLAGDDNGYKYSGYPRFNCPDAIVDSLKKAGFDMLLTANNHSYDTGITGFMRTQEILRNRGVTYIGTRYKEEDKNYTVQNINGINVGMICYTLHDCARSRKTLCHHQYHRTCWRSNAMPFPHTDVRYRGRGIVEHRHRDNHACPTWILCTFLPSRNHQTP